MKCSLLLSIRTMAIVTIVAVSLLSSTSYAHLYKKAGNGKQTWVVNKNGAIYIRPAKQPGHLTAAQFDRIAGHDTQLAILNRAAWKSIQNGGQVDSAGKRFYNSREDFLNQLEKWDQYLDAVIQEEGNLLSVGASQKAYVSSKVRTIFKPVYGALDIEIDHMPAARYYGPNRAGVELAVSRPVLNDVHRGIHRSSLTTAQDGNLSFLGIRTTGSSTAAKDILAEKRGRLNTNSGGTAKTNHLNQAIADAEAATNHTFTTNQRSELEHIWALSVNAYDTRRAEDEVTAIISLAEEDGILNFDNLKNARYWEHYLGGGVPNREADVDNAINAVLDVAARNGRNGFAVNSTNLKNGYMSEDARDVVKYMLTGNVPSLGSSSYEQALSSFADKVRANLTERYPSACPWYGI